MLAYCHVLEWLHTGFGLGIGFIDHFNTRLVTTLTYSAIADLHTLQITTAHAKPFQSAESSSVVPWLRLLIVEFLQLPCSFHFPLALNGTDYVFSSETPLQLTEVLPLTGFTSALAFLCPFRWISG
jgi:hypothetical protein